jgi:hypothetical protein
MNLLIIGLFTGALLATFWISINAVLDELIVFWRRHPVRCAWCGVRIKFGNPFRRTSHGMCRECQVVASKGFVCR